MISSGRGDGGRGALEVRGAWQAAHGRADFGIDEVRIDGASLRVTRADLMTHPFGALLAFDHAAASEGSTLVVAPIAGAFPVLLRDLVLGLLRHGRVAVTDWRNAREVPLGDGPFGLAENVGFVSDAMRRLGPGLHVVGVCQGCVAALAATALVSAERPDSAPHSLTLIGGPIDPHASRTRIASILSGHPPSWFDDHVLATVSSAYRGAGRRVYPATRQFAILLGYLCRHMHYGDDLFWKAMWDDGENPVLFPFMQLCMRLMDLPAELVLDMVRSVFQTRAPAHGRPFAGQRIDFDAMARTALLTVEGDRDDISGPGQTRAAHRLCRAIPTARRRHFTLAGAGHFSLFHGRGLRQHVLPEILRHQEQSRLRH